MTPCPWSTQPVTGAQHDAWMAEERAAKPILYMAMSIVDYGDGWVCACRAGQPVTTHHSTCLYAPDDVARAAWIRERRRLIEDAFKPTWNQRSEYTEFMQGWSADVKAHPPRISS